MTANAVDRTLAALADPCRRQAIDLLREHPRRAGELATSLAVAPSVMSRHLQVLKQAGLVEEAHPVFDARVRIYSLRPDPLREIRTWLEEAERGWSEQLGALARYLAEEP